MIALLFLDQDSIKEVNYPLLTTFCVFFVFSGNVAGMSAVNIWGYGTLIASLASLITFSAFKKHQPEKFKGYIIMISVINFSYHHLVLKSSPLVFP